MQSKRFTYDWPESVRSTSRRFSYLAMGGCLLFILLCKFVPVVAEWYSVFIYPTVASLLAAVSKYIPFSLYDLFIAAAILYLVVTLLRMAFCRIPARTGLGQIVRFLIWLYIGFYFSWGMNYYRYNFYQRNRIMPVQVDSSAYYDFAVRYVEQLNALCPDTVYVPLQTDSLIRVGYRDLGQTIRLSTPWLLNRPKPILWSGIMAKMGIKGYIGAYFNEPLLSRQLMDEEYPFTSAHELAHVLGISSEAEANLMAFLVCSESSDAQIQYSGYASLLGYVLSNASRVLTEKQFISLRDRISPCVRERYTMGRKHWSSLYSESLGNFQEWLYNQFLKGNHISTGVQNYSQVIGYLIAYQSWKAQSINNEKK